MNIFVLEDDLAQQQRLKQFIRELTVKNQIVYKNLLVFSKPNSLLEQVKNAVNHQIYFLDLEIDGEERKGLEVAQEIRKIDPYGTIVFVTTHSELAPTTFSYKVSALEFIEKDLDEVQFKKKVEDCLILAYSQRHVPVNKDTFKFENKYTSFQIPFSDIYYFETTETNHKVRLISRNKVIEFNANLKDIEIMDQRFFRCHRSFVVNTENISYVDKTAKKILFPNDNECAVSRRLLAKTVDKFNSDE